MNANGRTVKEHFQNRAPEVKATYAAILKAAKTLGPVKEEAKKTSIHLVRNSAFAGVAMRKSALILTLKSDSDVTSKRIAKREQASPHRWHLELKLKRLNKSIAKSWLGSRRHTNSQPNTHSRLIWQATNRH
jgi:hypothetical protein